MIVVCAPADLIEELSDISEHFRQVEKDEIGGLKAEIILYLHDDWKSVSFPVDSVVIINEVVDTLREHGSAGNLLRINGWKGFLKRNVWEMAGENFHSIESALSLTGKKIIRCPDEPGFIAPRVVCMIINEAFFTKEEQVSTEEDIDIAMKLGTGYPYGPFEWGRLIGIKKVGALLEKLSKTDKRYKVSPSLKKACQTS